MVGSKFMYCFLFFFEIINCASKASFWCIALMDEQLFSKSDNAAEFILGVSNIHDYLRKRAEFAKKYVCKESQPVASQVNDARNAAHNPAAASDA